MMTLVTKKVLVLGYSEREGGLASYLKGTHWIALTTQERVDDFSQYDLVLSYGYRHILKPEALATAKRPIVNLHISYLPWNRGAHPLYWAVKEKTTVGVTIHEIDAGIDTGPIIFQRGVDVSARHMTYKSAYEKLRSEMGLLFRQNMDHILKHTYTTTPQSPAEGSFHKAKEMPEGFDWGQDIWPQSQHDLTAPVATKRRRWFG